MPMLRSVLEKKIRLVDYELMTNEQGARLVQFSRFAGYAGMIDTLYAVGHRLLGLGFGTPFLSMGMSYQYRSLEDGRKDVADTGAAIKNLGLPKQLGPMVFAFIGDGNVVQGALHVFEKLPHEWVSANDLANLATSTDFDTNKVYACKILPEDYLVRKDGGKFVRKDYFEHPDDFKSIFHEKIAPHVSVIVNGMFWTEKYPRLMTIDQTEQLAVENNLRLLTLADISCDINGPFEFMSEASTIDAPTFMYDPISKSTHHNAEGRGIQIMSIDNLPTELPLESSEYFSKSLIPFVSELAKGNTEHPVIQRASITTLNGDLVDRHQHLLNHLPEHGHTGSVKISGTKRVLLLGSGFVAGPLVDYLLRTPGTHVTIASNSKSEATRLADGRSATTVVPLNVSDQTELSSLVDAHDVVVSFVPATLHPIIAEQCLRHKKHLVTASYISPAMKAFDQRAKDAGLAFVNEVGLDPGIDHLTACQLFNQVKSAGGRITSFVSWCGGLPAPEASNNPLGYKFSWSPKGVLLAGLNSAKFKMDGKVHNIPGSELMKNVFNVPIFKGFAFEGVANRDSLVYTDLYNLGDLEDLDSMFRGTLRYKGYAEIMGAFNQLGLLDTTLRPELSTGISWGELLKQLVGSNIETDLAKKLALNPSNPMEAAKLDRVVAALKWLGITSETQGAEKGDSILDSLCALLQRKLVYTPGERDMVAMHHVFGIQHGNGKKETRTSTMIAYGSLKRRGVIAPMSLDIYEPMLKKLEREGVRFTEQTL
ncbi:saccharopine dehydrogenase [Batrachochytrium dendrobatidis JEL423]|uniref:Saccharopine dehydrogenase n=1 Tax=Batrachochytrium dendrobatidis (strain JEL423) TaxID=403673 RepID=A0A177WCE8_BATDL|nr:saccharopine dehydrogenase [Batrachochytrium dendrobatidis JEL423]